VVTVVLSEVGEAGSLRSVLSDETVGVLVGASFPGVMGCGEVEVGSSRGLDGLVAVELCAVIVGDGSCAPLGIVDEFDSASVGGLDGPGCELADDGEAGFAIDEREEAMLVGAEDGVAFEVTDATPVCGPRRSLRDGSFSGQTTPGVVPAVAFTALLLSAAKMAM
jgi:hypothetical protein